MSSCLLKLTLVLTLLTPAIGEVVIHDPAVRLLAKPFGIEKRIRLHCIDMIHSGPDDEKRLVFTLENSGFKEVLLKNPSFSLDIILPDGNWASLGELSGCMITFPVTDEKQQHSRTYTADFKSNLSCDDVSSYLRQAAQEGSPMRLIGKAEMEVRTQGKINFAKKGLKLELTGPVVLKEEFKVVKHRAAKTLPKAGVQ
jgi:hypothetical protein